MVSIVTILLSIQLEEVYNRLVISVKAEVITLQHCGAREWLCIRSLPQHE